MADYFVGMAGWTYEPWRGEFYPKGLRQSDELAYASTHVSSIELNGSFYSLQKPTSWQKWRDSTPDDFVFSVKAPKFITHIRRLDDVAEPVANFFASGILALGTKLGPILWQLPPRWNVNAERLESFLQLLPPEHRYAFELRNETWMCEEVYEVLRRYNAAFCIYELAGYRSPIVLTADWTYIRLHGPTAFKYQGSYTDAQLGEWAGRMKSWRRKLDSQYIYFDNDDSAYAVDNALTLKKLTGSRRKLSALSSKRSGRRRVASVPLRAEN
jgi:uncharacterized protein YecE (DUF72 family)